MSEVSTMSCGSCSLRIAEPNRAPRLLAFLKETAQKNREVAPRRVQCLTASSAPLRPAVTPKSPVGSFLGSSVELPSSSVRPEPSANSKVSEIVCGSQNASQAQESCQFCRMVPVFFSSGRDPSKIEKSKGNTNNSHCRDRHTCRVGGRRGSLRTFSDRPPPNRTCPF